MQFARTAELAEKFCRDDVVRAVHGKACVTSVPVGGDMPVVVVDRSIANVYTLLLAGSGTTEFISMTADPRVNFIELTHHPVFGPDVICKHSRDTNRGLIEVSNPRISEFYYTSDLIETIRCSTDYVDEQHLTMAALAGKEFAVGIHLAAISLSDCLSDYSLIFNKIFNQ